MPLGRVSPGPYRLGGHGHLHLKWIRLARADEVIE
jgi:hypothetical protein